LPLAENNAMSAEAFEGNTTPTPLSHACLFYLARSHRAELQDKQSFKGSSLFCASSLGKVGRRERSGVDEDIQTLLPNSRMSATEM